MSETEYATLMRRALQRIAETEAKLEALEREIKPELAVCAMACRLPGADSPERLWELLASRRSTVREVPRDRWEVERWYDADPERRGRSYSRWGCFIDDVAGFDAGLLGVSPREARWMDPQQRILLELVWELFERAGEAPDRVAGRSIGVFVGASGSDYLRLATADPERIDAHTGSGAAPSALAGRVAYEFGLCGPSLTLDTACSSSLVALHLACAALRRGECDAAIVAGSSLMLTPHMSLIEARTRMLAPDGRCKSFDAEADGVVRGEGLAAIYLRRREDAVADGSPMIALIRGSAVNQNGRGASLTTPHVGAQQALLHAALRDAGLPGWAIEVVEAHGTGTALGDPIEAQALSAAFGPERGSERPLWLGSIKPNVGHLEATAGIAGVIKAASMIERGRILPSIHVEQPTPKIDWRGAKLALIRSEQAWPGGSDSPRYTGVSSFGFAGTNAHVILERAPASDMPDMPDTPEGVGWLALSARTPEALAKLAVAWRDRLQAPASAGSLDDLCFTALHGRAGLPERLAVVGDRSAMITALYPVAPIVEDLRLRRRASESVLLGCLLDSIAELAIEAELEPNPSAGHERALHAKLVALEAELGLRPSPRSDRERERFVAAIVRLTALIDRGLTPDELTGVGPGRALAAGLAGALELDAAIELAWIEARHRHGDGPTRATLAAAHDARRSTLAWRPPTLGLLAATGERLRSRVATLRWLALGDESCPVAAREALRAVGATTILRPIATDDDDELGIPTAPLERAAAWLEAALWTRGHQPWTRERGRAKRVLAPSYPFEHEPYWLPELARGEQARTETAPHPLLGAALKVVGDPRPRFQATIASDAPAWLGDHRVFGRVMFPGAGWVELVLAAGRAVCGVEALELRDLEFLAPLLLEPGRSVAVQTVLEARAGGAWSVEIHARPLDHDDWTTHARASVAALDHPGVARERPASLDTLDPEQPAALEARARGVEFGPRFQALAGVGRSPTGEALATLQLAPELDGSAAWALHPILLDACMRAIAIDPSFDVGDDAWIPTGIARLRRWRATPARAWSTATSEAASGRRLAAATCYTDAGQPCFELTGLELVRQAAQQSVQQTSQQGSQQVSGQPWRPWIHALAWRRLGPCVAPAVATASLTRAAEAEAVDAELLARVARYAEGLAALEVLAGELASAQLAGLGGLEPGAVVELEQLRDSWRARPSFDGAITRLLTILVERGELEAIDASHWRVIGLAPTAELDRRFAIFAERHPELRDELASLRRSGSRLAEILRGQADPLELLMDGDAGTVEALYRAPMIQLKNRRIAGLVRALISARPDAPLRVLEVGGGTGETTAEVIAAFEALGLAPLEYCFTDVSPAFLERARERFAGRPWLRTRRLDLDEPAPVAADGLGRFDLVIASNVLHVTRELERSLATVHGLLSPGATLILMEGAKALRWVDLSFGLTPGWWRFTDRDLRPNYPLLRPEAWTALLTRQGFATAEQLRPARDDLEILRQQAVIVASADPRSSARADARWLLIGGGAVGEQLGDAIAELGEDVTALARVSPTTAMAELVRGPPALRGRSVDLHDRQAIAELLRALEAQGSAPTSLVLLDGLDPELQAVDLESCRASLHVVQAVVDALAQRPPAVWLVTRGAVATSADERVDGLAHAPVWGLGRVLASEHPELTCRRVDLDPGLDSELGPELGSGSIDALLHTLRGAGQEDELALRAGVQWAPRLGRAELDSPARARVGPAAGTALITGGFGGVGIETARWLAERGVRHIALLGRSAPSPAALAKLDALAATGVELRRLIVDVSCPGPLAEALAELRRSMPPLRQVFHSAGVIADATIHKLDWPRFAEVLGPKLDGAWNLHRLTREDPLDRFVLYSSAVALLRSPGQANHCAANTFLGALAEHRRGRGLPATVIDWGAWARVGAATRVADASLRMDELGMATMAPEQALAALEAVLDAELGHAAIFPIDWRRFAASRRIPLFGELLADTDAPAPEAQATLRVLLDGLDLRDAGERLREHLRELVARTAGLSRPEVLDDRRPLFELGLDSLMAIELRNQLARELGRRLRTTLLFDFPTIEALTRHLLEELGHGDAPSQARPATVELPTRSAHAARSAFEAVAGLDETALCELIDAEFAAFASKSSP